MKNNLTLFFLWEPHWKFLWLGKIICYSITDPTSDMKRKNKSVPIEIGPVTQQVNPLPSVLASHGGN